MLQAQIWCQPTMQPSPLHHIPNPIQVLYYTPARANGTWSDEHQAYTLSPEHLPFFVDSDWNLLTTSSSQAQQVSSSPSPAEGAAEGAAHVAAGRCAAAELLPPHLLHFLVYVPPRGQRPLLALAPGGSAAASNSFWIPSWGGVVVVNPPQEHEGACAAEGGGSSTPGTWTLGQEEYARVAGTVVAQLRALLGLSAYNGPVQPGAEQEQQRPVFLPSPVSGFALWEVEALLRQRVAGDAAAVGKVCAAAAVRVGCARGCSALLVGGRGCELESCWLHSDPAPQRTCVLSALHSQHTHARFALCAAGAGIAEPPGAGAPQPGDA